MKVVFKFNYCEYEAEQKRYMKTLMHSMHESKTFQCPLCNYKATRKDHLKTHMKSIHFNVLFVSIKQHVKPL